MYQDMDNIHMYGPSIYSKEVHSNRFWEDTFKVYELFRYKVKPESSEEALAEPLFLNIKVGKKCILFKSWLEKGIYCIGHVIDEEGRFINITNSQKNTIFKLTIWNTLDVYRPSKHILKASRLLLNQMKWL